SHPAVNQVERSPSAERTVEPLIFTLPFVPTASTWVTCSDGPATGLKATRSPGTFRARAALRASTSIGPQSWYGERVSYGSSPEPTSGTFSPPASAGETARPRELAEKSVAAPLPP